MSQISMKNKVHWIDANIAIITPQASPHLPALQIV